MSLGLAIADGVTARNAESIAKLLDIHSRVGRVMSATGRKQITVHGPATIVLDSTGGPKIYEISGDVALGEADLDTGSFVAGTDYYVYLCDNGGGGEFVISANASFPSGYTASTSRKIGGFHTLCADVGTISGHSLSTWLATEILPASVWDLQFRPDTEYPEAMVWHPGTRLWWDIYLASWNGSRLVSAYGATIADGASTKKFHWYKFAEEFGKIGKRMPFQIEFIPAAKGSPEGVNISGSADPGTTGGHSATSGSRIVSHIGCEDMTGVLWQWGSDGGATNDVGSAWADAFDSDGASDASEAVGQHYEAPNRPRFGGSWSDGANCGSRGSSWNNSPLVLSSSFGARGVAVPFRRRA
jgi:hypothetical protein